MYKVERWGRAEFGFDQAVPLVCREVVFTTHTPVPVGRDRLLDSTPDWWKRTSARCEIDWDYFLIA